MQKTHILIFTIFVINSSFGITKTLAPKNLKDLSFEKLPINEKTKKKILKGEVYSQCHVDSFVKTIKGKEEKQQKLKFNIIGLHKNNCKTALRVISHYENYKNLVDFIKISNYQESTKQIHLGVKHSLFPIPLAVKFQIPRIVKPGIYPYHFPKGFLPDLRGQIRVFEHEGRCLFHTDAHWQGPHTGYFDSVLGIFAQTASRIGMEKIFRVSSF